MLCNLGRKVITNLDIPLARDNLPGLVNNSAWDVKNKFERNISGKKSSQIRKKIYFIYFEWIMNDIEIIKSSEDLGILTDGVAEAAKHKI